jgi:hypothetical protein
VHRRVIYPIERLLANSSFFTAISMQLGGIIKEEELYEFFFDLYSTSINPEFVGPIDEDSFPEKVCFECYHEEGSDSEFVLLITTDTGITLQLSGTAHNMSESSFKDEDSLQRASYIYHRIVRGIEEAVPELEGDISLTETPSPANNFLQEQDNNKTISGSFNLFSDPEKLFTFQITYDSDTNTPLVKVSPAN